jgi:hypothetical protein
MRPASETHLKKPYRPPKLTIYGDLTQMTLFMALGKGMTDNKAMTKRT